MNITVPVRTIRKAALAADADPRTVTKLVSGQRVRGVVAERIEAALRQLGIEPPPAPAADGQPEGGHQ